jgi:polyhydroxyalkanoate synthesis regulator phasin
MIDIVRKSFLFGLGVIALTKEKAQNFVEDLKKNEKITPEEGKKLVKDMMKKSEEFSKKIRKEIRKQIQVVVKEMGLATKDDIQKLRTELKKK